MTETPSSWLEMWGKGRENRTRNLRQTIPRINLCFLSSQDLLSIWVIIIKASKVLQRPRDLVEANTFCFHFLSVFFFPFSVHSNGGSWQPCQPFRVFDILVIQYCIIRCTIFLQLMFWEEIISAVVAAGAKTPWNVIGYRSINFILCWICLEIDSAAV